MKGSTVQDMMYRDLETFPSLLRVQAKENTNLKTSASLLPPTITTTTSHGSVHDNLTRVAQYPSWQW